MVQNAAQTYKPASSGRKELISELYQRYGKKLYAYAVHSWNLSEDEAWDMIYQSLYKVIDSYTKYSFASEQKFASFIFRVFVNCLRNHYRQQQKVSEHMVITPMNEEAENKSDSYRTDSHRTEITATDIPSEKLKLLQEELEKMEDWQRILLLMRSDGRPYSEIAAYVHKPEDQLKVYYQRLKKQIADKLYERL